MVALYMFLYAFYFPQFVVARCPFETWTYHDPATKKNLCYIKMGFYEIMNVRKDFWKEPGRPNYLDASGYDVVDTKWDALRMCQMVPYIKVDDPPVTFLPSWKQIPGPDVELRLPTPKTVEHIKWLSYRLLINDNWNTIPGNTEKYWWRWVGKMWLGIEYKDAPPNWQSVKPSSISWQLEGKTGNCGYLFRDDMKAANCYDSGVRCYNCTGLYWVSCDDAEPGKGVEDKDNTWQSYWQKGTHVVACEFDEPEDCKYELDKTACVFSKKHNDCMLAGKYKVVKKGHRLGIGCPKDSFHPLDIKCPQKYQHQCAQPCEWSYWQGGWCMVDKKYLCQSGDINTLMTKTRKVIQKARFGGKCNMSESNALERCSCVKGNGNVVKGTVFQFIVVGLLVLIKE